MLTEDLKGSTTRRFAPRSDRVLFVDDERPVLDAMQRILRREPYEVMTTERPEEALEWIARGGINLVVADQRMPTMTGTELLEAARIISPELNGVILTAYPRTSVLLDAANQGVRRLITKPWDDDDLRGIIRDLLARVEWDAHLARGGRPARDGGATAGVLEERVVRIDAAGRTAESIVRPISAILRHPGVIRSGLVILLDRLDQIDDPSREFFPKLLRCMQSAEVRPSIVDGTGRAQACLESLGGVVPYVAYGPGVTGLRRKRVLLFTEDAAAGNLLAALLRGLGCSCDLPETPEEGVMRLGMTPYDLVILAIDRPESPGERVGRYVLGRGLEIPVLLLSHSLDRWDTDDCARLGVGRMLPQPFRLRDFVDALEER